MHFSEKKLAYYKGKVGEGAISVLYTLGHWMLLVNKSSYNEVFAEEKKFFHHAVFLL